MEKNNLGFHYYKCFICYIHIYPPMVVCLTWKFFQMCTTTLNITLQIFAIPSLVFTIVLAYLISLAVLWDSKNEKLFMKASYFIWFAVSAHTASYFYLPTLPVFIFFQLLFGTGFIMSQKTYIQQDEKATQPISSQENNEVFESNLAVSKIEEPTSYSPHSLSYRYSMERVRSTLHELGLFTGDNTSDIYIYWVSIACLVTLVLQSGWIPYCIVLLLVIYTVRCLCKSFGITDFCSAKIDVFQTWLYEWCKVRHNALVPAPISYLNMVFIDLRAQLLRWLKYSSDSAASIMVILGLVIFVIFGSTFLVIQAYTEGVYMVKMGGSVLNKTVVHNPELTQLLPDGWEHQLDSMLNNVYTYGRQALSKLLKSTLSGLGEDKMAELESRALEVWDRVYQAYLMSAIEQKTTIGPKVTPSAVYQTWDNFLDAMNKTPELVSMSALTKLAQENMATLTSGLESAWELIKGNASLVYGSCLTVLSLIFSHSYAVLRFCINMIVFLTALFYLLCSSRQLYKPVEVITAASPVFGHRLAFAMENAVKEVLTASFRLALFYGMWTWLIHSLFQMNIVYIPSVLAAMLSVVPVLGTYWACLPAVLDLWIHQGKNIHAITLAVCQFLPSLFVDETIYSEINEGHPYLTGLSVAGGLFCMGIEGAIIGPLILCCLYVVVSMSSAIMSESSTSTFKQSYPVTSGTN